MQPSAILGVGTLLGFFLGMVLFIEVGHRLRLRAMLIHPEKSTAGLGVVEGALFGLMGLVIAFRFSGAAARTDAR
jgi:hypothetical protein